MPIPIQSGSMSDRLRRFFRIRGKTNFQLDEIVAPVVLVQDLTQGPYLAGVTPAATRARIQLSGPNFWSFAVLLNDKPGSLTPILGNQFNNRSFSFTWAEIVNIAGFTAAELSDLRLGLAKRSDVVAAGVPLSAFSFSSIQNNDGTVFVPVESFQYEVAITNVSIWRGLLGDNTNVAGSRREFDNIQPNITIGPDDALVLTTGLAGMAAGIITANYRGFYQEQPA